METILGIDLGTTNSVVAVVQDGKPTVVKDAHGRATLPSVVGLDAEGNLLVGEPARNQAVMAPQRTVRSIKRKMGEEVQVTMGDSSFAPQEISAMILRTLKQRAEREAGREIKKAVMGIVTDSTPVEDPKDVTTPVFQLWELFAEPAEREVMFARAKAGGVGYGEVKKDLLRRVMELFEPMRARREELAAHPEKVEEILAEGGRRARSIGRPVLDACRDAAGLGPAG